MQGNSSYGSIGRSNSFLWQQGREQAPTQFLDANLNAFEEGKMNSSSNSHMYRSIMYPLPSPLYNTIRFQVLIWSIGSPDVKTARVSIKFRVTLFWNDNDNANDNDKAPRVVPNGPDADANINANATTNTSTATKSNGPTIWVMSGRTRAYEKNLSDTLRSTSTTNPNNTCTNRVVNIPPVSILNSDSFETIGQPEITLLKEDTRLMRWSCMYRAQLHQEDMSVREFPHDSHRLCIKLGILSHRQPGGLWDRNKWKLALANESDTQRTIKVPHGLIVDNVRIPGFHYNKDTELEFDLVPLSHGSSSIPKHQRQRQRGSVDANANPNTIPSPNDTDYFLRTSLKVSRDSGYYDNNIMPLLGMLNIVAISILTMDATNFFKRALLALNIAFVEIGLRMTLDSHLPHVGYSIKIQKVLNWFFFSILSQMLESAILNFLLENGYCSLATTRHVDAVVVIMLLSNQVYLSLYYTKKDDLFEYV